jgi:hypothetical protein
MSAIVNAEIESVNYDYLPGEPESRRTLYVTLRQEPYGIQRGMQVKILPTEAIFTVEDIFGRNVVCKSSTSTDDLRMGISLYTQRPVAYNLNPVYLSYPMVLPRMYNRYT